MLPMKVMSDQLASTLAADASGLGNASALKVGLIVQEFTPSIDLVMADLEISAATNLVPLAGVAGAQLESVDPVSGEQIVELKVPAGGFRWETPVGFVGPVTVYGFAVGNNAMTLLYGTERLSQPIVLTVPNEAITAPTLEFRLDPSQIH